MGGELKLVKKFLLNKIFLFSCFLVVVLFSTQYFSKRSEVSPVVLQKNNFDQENDTEPISIISSSLSFLISCGFLFLSYWCLNLKTEISAEDSFLKRMLNYSLPALLFCGNEFFFWPFLRACCSSIKKGKWNQVFSLMKKYQKQNYFFHDWGIFLYFIPLLFYLWHFLSIYFLYNWRSDFENIKIREDSTGNKYHYPKVEYESLQKFSEFLYYLYQRLLALIQPSIEEESEIKNNNNDKTQPKKDNREESKKKDNREESKKKDNRVESKKVSEIEPKDKNNFRFFLDLITWKTLLLFPLLTIIFQDNSNSPKKKQQFDYLNIGLNLFLGFDIIFYQSFSRSLKPIADEPFMNTIVKSVFRSEKIKEEVKAIGRRFYYFAIYPLFYEFCCLPVLTVFYHCWRQKDNQPLSSFWQFPFRSRITTFLFFAAYIVIIILAFFINIIPFVIQKISEAKKTVISKYINGIWR